LFEYLLSVSFRSIIEFDTKEVKMNIKSLLLSGIIAGTIMAVLSSLPLISFLNCFACFWLWASGILGSGLYRLFQGKSLTSSLTGGQGAVVGIFSGLIGAVVYSILGTIIGGAGLASGLAPLLASQSKTVEDVVPGTLVSFFTAGTFSIVVLLFNIIIFPFFGAIGGAIGGVLFGKPASAAGVQN
jgi:hypothetical protein